MELHTDMFRSPWKMCATQLVQITHPPATSRRQTYPRQPVRERSQVDNMCFNQGTPRFYVGHSQCNSGELSMGSKSHAALGSLGGNWSPPMIPPSKNNASAKTKMLCLLVHLGDSWNRMRKKRYGTYVVLENTAQRPCVFTVLGKVTTGTKLSFNL